MNITTLSNNIRKVRQWRGLTQENVANDLSISLTSYGRIEQGKTNVSYSRLQQIADYFKVEVDVFFQTANESDNIVSDSQEYQYKDKAYRRLDKLEKEVEELKIDIKLIKAHLFGSSSV